MTQETVFQEPEATELATLRSKMRWERRLTYDCMNAIVKGDIVVCKKGHPFRARGRSTKTGISVLAILRGTSSGECRNCEDYNGEDTE